MRPLFVMPVINEQMTDECLATIDPKHYKDILMIDNSDVSFTQKYLLDGPKSQIGKIVQYGQNVGVSRAWNLGVNYVIAREWDYLVIVSASMRFEDGMNDFVRKLQHEKTGKGLETQHGWHFIALGRKVFEKIGFFDENFYPAYYEDSDIIRRMELAGIHLPMSKTERIPWTEIKAKSQGNAQALKTTTIKVNIPGCLEYFIEKWGAEPLYDSQASRDKMYKHPFNNPKFDLNYWPKYSIQELKDKYNLN